MKEHGLTLIAFNKEKELVGQVYGQLTIIETIRESHKGKRMVLVQCSCGRKIISPKQEILFGGRKNCGKERCKHNFIDRSGKEYANIKVLELLRFEKSTSVWKIQCKLCDQLFEENSQRLGELIKLDLACGACGIKSSRAKNCVIPEEGAINRTFGYYINGAKDRKLSFNIDIEYFKKLIFSKCFYCNKEGSTRLKFSNSTGSYDVPRNGIDRVDNDKGYEPNNVVTCCYDCNFKKYAVTKQIIIKAAEFLKLQNDA